MRGNPRTTKLLRPRSVGDALRTYARHPDAHPLAGGTDLMVAWNAGHLAGDTMIDLTEIGSWKRIRELEGGLAIGSLADMTRIQEHPLVRQSFPLLANACATVGAAQIQNRATLGGNIANASPAGDTFPALAVYEAIVHIASTDGRRSVPFLEIFAGVKKTTLETAEIITSIQLPLGPRPARRMFRKVGTRAAQAISKVVAAGHLRLRRDGTVRELRFALGSVAPTVRRLRAAEEWVEGKRLTPRVVDTACDAVEEDISPIDDLRSTRAYRLEVSRNLLRAFLSG